MHLLEVLREECGIVSAKNGCAPEGVCGCCLVLVDGTPGARRACASRSRWTATRCVTLEGLPEETRRVLGEAFVLEGGVQCGFCIPGIVVRAASLIEQGKTDDRTAIAKALDGHLCRCTGYGRIIDAIQTAGEAASQRRPPAAHGAATAFLLRRRVRAASRIRRSPNGRRHGATATASAVDRATRRRWSRRSATSRSSTTCACPACCTARWC